MSNPWDPYTNSYNIHEETKIAAALAASAGAKPFHETSLDEARILFSSAYQAACGEVDFKGEVQELSVPSPDVADGIPVTIYKPSNLATTPAILVFFHGGGLIILERKNYETALKIVAMDAGCIVVNVGYRLLPYPGTGLAPFDDATVVTKWVLENRDKLGVPDSKVGVGGHSAGGQLAATMSNEVAGLSFQVLVCPNVDLELSQPSVEEFAEAPGLSKADILWSFKYLEEAIPDYLTNPRVNPMVRTDVGLSPPTLVVVAQLDPIRDSGLVYAEKLRAAGVPVRIMVIEGVSHSFFSLCGVFKTKSREALGHIAHFLKDFQ